MSAPASINIRDNNWLVTVATQPWELAQGLAGLIAMPSRTGMLFALGQEQLIQVTTVNMLFPLDIAFISEALVITEVYRNVEPGYLVTSEHPARYFLEVNAGEMAGIDSGDKVLLQVQSLEPLLPADWTSSLIDIAIFMMVMSFMTGIVLSFIGPDQKKREEILPALTRQRSAALIEIAEWYCQQRRPLTVTVLHPIASKYFSSDEELEEFYQYLESPQGQSRFREELRDAMKRHGITGPETKSSEMKLIPIEKQPCRGGDLEYLADSPEFLAYTIDDIGYRDKLDHAFQQAIARAKRIK